MDHRQHEPRPVAVLDVGGADKDGIYWKVESGCQWGSLARGASRELWHWDGRRAEEVDGVGCVISY